MNKLENCINCGLCKEICPTSAITYQYKNGFKVAIIDEKKCIGCNKCIKICPLKQTYKQIKSPKPIVLRLKDQIKIDKSSSGGVFGEIAREYIKKGYIIYGAKFDKDFYLSHKRISKYNELKGILKSKYVQSDISQIIPKVKEDLDSNNNVIFSGTSCQIAALKKYLKKDYDNLITIDLICHGAPSPKIWMNYIKHLENKEKSKIKKLDFRYNNSKDPSKNFKISFENGRNIETSLYESNYGWAFLNNVILNNSCYNCKFKNSKTLSDITLGDAHSFCNDKYKNKFSLVIINTEKGNKIIESVEHNFEIYKNIDLEKLISNNYPILYSPLKHPNSKYVLTNLDNQEKNKILTNYKENHIKFNEKNIGILNFYYENYNYGANLVAYALSEVIKNLGYIPYIINFNPFLPLETFEQFKTIEFVKFREKYLNLTKEYKDNDELEETNNYINTFIVGSDQVWRKTITQNNFLTYFLNFVYWDKKCLAYAASFGNNIFEGSETEKKECDILLNKFIDISVREEDAKNIIKDISNLKSTQVLDPTLLLTTEDYNKLLIHENQKDINEEYIAIYCLFEQEECFVQDIHKLFNNKKVIDIKLKDETITLLNKDYEKYRSIPEWINLIKNASFVITDSYHGMLFSILYNKEFICLGGNSKAKSRFNTINYILKGNINKRIFKTLKDIDNLNNIANLNYKEINKNLEINRNKSLEYLSENLKKECKKSNLHLLTKYDNLIKNSKEIIAKKNQLQEILYSEKQIYIQDITNINNQIQDLTNKYNELFLQKEQLEYNNKVLENISLNKDKIIKENENKIREKDKIINDILSSNSWQITKPLRKIREKVGRKTWEIKK